MKIIEQGLSNEEIERMKNGIKTFKCAVCGCKFEADMCEYNIQPCDYNENEYVCRCPNCGFVARETEG